MPLFQVINHSSTTQILVWEITESFNDLFSKVELKEKSQIRLRSMKSELHQRAFLSVRMLLAEAGYTDFELHYDEFGKPYFNDNKYISISHSHQFSAIIISYEKVGIDIEMQREKITSIADKFINSKELICLNKDHKTDYIKKITCVWGAKEAIFKIRNEKGISFKNHIQVDLFEMQDKKTTATLNFQDTNELYEIHFKEIENYVLIYALVS